jgi:hypothetical protein
MYTWRKVDARSCKCCCSGKTVSVTYSECVLVVLCIQHAMCIRHIVICGMSGCTNFFHISRTNFEETLLNIKCVFCFHLQTFSETVLVLRKTERHIIKYVYWSSCKVKGKETSLQALRVPGG